MPRKENSSVLFCLRLMAFAALLTLSGCGQSGPPLFDVEGVVKLDGKPLSSAELTFIPDPSNKDVTPGTGFSDTDGSYVARYLDRAGLAEGKYTVTIRKSEITDTEGVPEEMKADQAQLEMMGLTKQTLKNDYTTPEKTPFKIEVKPGESQSHNFELTK
ncbi:MAG: hypothetical protein RJA81_961 [Planctomycetota bacterium]|jgi:hypothetical protein